MNKSQQLKHSAFLEGQRAFKEHSFYGYCNPYTTNSVGRPFHNSFKKGFLLAFEKELKVNKELLSQFTYGDRINSSGFNDLSFISQRQADSLREEMNERLNPIRMSKVLIQ